MHGLPQSVSAQSQNDGANWQDANPRRSDGQRVLTKVNIADEPQASLVRTIEAEIIPRLVLAHPRGQPAGGVNLAACLAGGAASTGQVEAFVTIVLAGDTHGTVSFIETLRSGGATLEMLCMDLLSPAARRLGDLWNADLCDFAQVTLALWRLQQLLRELGQQFPSAVASRESGLRALLVPALGEEHTLGLAMVTEFFRRAGWRVSGGPPKSVEQLRQMVGADWFDVAGLAISCETRLRLLAQSIRALRQASRNPDIRVLVGGTLFVQRPELVALVGADATATDARHAPAQAEQLLALLLSRPHCR